jgi:hypothetical protein
MGLGLHLTIFIADEAIKVYFGFSPFTIIILAGRLENMTSMQTNIGA